MAELQHLVVPGTDPAAPPVLLLHGSSGSEHDLVGLGRRLSPGSTMLAPRGTVTGAEGRAFFRRHEDRRVDEDDLVQRVPALADLVRRRAGRVAPVAIGFSNGAIMAAALLMLHPDALSGAVLLRPLSPFVRPPAVDLRGLPVLVVDGADDERRSAGDGSRLAEELRARGADVTHRVLSAGHAVTRQDEVEAAAWLRTARA